MNFSDFIGQTQGLAVIDTKIFSAGSHNTSSLSVQISRWVKAGKLIQLKRGIYLLAEPYRKIQPGEYCIANILKTPSYISLEKAFEYYGLIPEGVAVFTSVTTKRPEIFKTPLGRFDYRHLQPSLFWGYNSPALQGRTVFMASLEKALLDFFYLRQGEVSLEYLREMRLQNLEKIKVRRLRQFACRFKKPGLLRVTELITQYIKKESKGRRAL